ncbi:MAG: type II toxin-antitoxin system VapC family toxin [Tepidiformaceae bacterium]
MALNVLDSDLAMDILNGQGTHRAAIESAIADRQLVTTSITRFEVLCGTRSDEKRTEAHRFFGLLGVLPFDDLAADAAAIIDQYLRANGIRLPTADTLIAGIAMSHGYGLLTRNRRHFERIPGLVIEEL